MVLVFAGTLAQVLPAGGLAVYVGVTEWVTLSVVAVHLRLEDDIRSGLLEPHLLRPKAYLVQKAAEAFGGMAARLLVLGATALALLALSGRAPDHVGGAACTPRRAGRCRRGPG